MAWKNIKSVLNSRQGFWISRRLFFSLANWTKELRCCFEGYKFSVLSSDGLYWFFVVQSGLQKAHSPHF